MRTAEAWNADSGTSASRHKRYTCLKAEELEGGVGGPGPVVASVIRTVVSETPSTTFTWVVSGRTVLPPQSRISLAQGQSQSSFVTREPAAPST